MSKTMWLEEVWNTIDLSENLAKTMDWIREVEDGFSSWLLFAFSLAAFIGTLTLSWMFDLSTSWEAMTTLREMADTKLQTTSFATYSIYLLAVLTYMPTIFEMFGAQLAKRQVRWMQILVIGLSIFDLYTDLPAVRDFMNPYYGNFVSDAGGPLANLFGWVSFYICFGVWWALASYGFEFACVLCGVSAFCFFLKGMAGNPASGRQAARGRG
jgi:hypothetical protein